MAGIPVQRATFTEITKKAVTAALASPRQIDQSMVDAYLARRALDRLFGYTLSPLLWRKLPSARSAGEACLRQPSLTFSLTSILTFARLHCGHGHLKDSGAGSACVCTAGHAFWQLQCSDASSHHAW